MTNPYVKDHMYTPPELTVYNMEMMGHMGPESLDAIATKFYGRTYKGQQTGDMIRNDSHELYSMDEESVAEIIADLNQEPKRHYIKFDPVNRKGIYAEGVNAIEYWLGLEDSPERYDDPTSWKPGDNLDTIRAAPEPRIILADLISKGELPYGRYLMHVWW